MADIIDSTQEFTITLLLEGFATIVSVSAPSTAHEGETITVNVTVRNDGEASDTIWCRLVDTYDNTEIGARQEAVLDVGQETIFTWSLTMPGRDLTIRVEAGHVE
ncbi:MAG: hypothetical protein DRP12_00090 [Candidatus Aenigmatarchaeota archaeon]|nr:MAG: hypothetical protein DRP12_00090 [Candidatus Aenigmarchaeota archaeon]